MASKRSKTIRRDPAQAGRVIDAYEKDLKQLTRQLVARGIGIIQANHDPESAARTISDAYHLIVEIEGKRLAREYARKSFLQGKLYAEMNLRKAGVGRDNA